MTHLLDRVIEAESGLGTDDEKIERIGHAVFEAYPPPHGQPRKNDLGAMPAEDTGACQNG